MTIFEKFAVNTEKLHECSDCGRLLIPGDEYDDHDCTGDMVLDPDFFEVPDD